MRNRYMIAALYAVVLLVSAVWVAAQSVVVRPVPQTIVSGENFGFLIEGDRGGTPIGRLVVKRDGQ